MSIREVPTAIMVTVWPEDAESYPETAMDSCMWVVSVVYRGLGKWAVVRGDHNGHFCLSRDDQWHIEPRPSDRDGTWVEQHRYTQEEALKRAREWAPKVKFNGITAAELVEQKSRQLSEGADEALAELRERLGK